MRQIFDVPISNRFSQRITHTIPIHIPQLYQNNSTSNTPVHLPFLFVLINVANRQSQQVMMPNEFGEL